MPSALNDADNLGNASKGHQIPVIIPYVAVMLSELPWLVLEDMMDCFQQRLS